MFFTAKESKSILIVYLVLLRTFSLATQHFNQSQCKCQIIPVKVFLEGNRSELRLYCRVPFSPEKVTFKWETQVNGSWHWTKVEGEKDFQTVNSFSNDKSGLGKFKCCVTNFSCSNKCTFDVNATLIKRYDYEQLPRPHLWNSEPSLCRSNILLPLYGHNVSLIPFSNKKRVWNSRVVNVKEGDHLEVICKSDVFDLKLKWTLEPLSVPVVPGHFDDNNSRLLDCSYESRIEGDGKVVLINENVTSQCLGRLTCTASFMSCTLGTASLRLISTPLDAVTTDMLTRVWDKFDRHVAVWGYLKPTVRSTTPVQFLGKINKAVEGDDSYDGGNGNIAASVGAPITIVAILSITVIGVLLFVRRRRRRRDAHKHRTYEIKTISGSPLPAFTTLANLKKKTSDLEEFPRKNIRFLNTIGQGTFGMVIKANVLNIKQVKGRPAKEWTTVAVKTTQISDSGNDAVKKDFLSELNLMKTVPGHINIITLFAGCTAYEPYLMLLEYAPHGDLRKFLQELRMEKNYSNAAFSAYGITRKQQSPELQDSALSEDERYVKLPVDGKSAFTSKDLMSFALQIGRGMAHLAMNKIVHRDVAARNILLFENNLVKISDFGLARHLGHTNVYERTRKGLLPIRWMSPEALFYNQYTEKSDVWSFGVLMWELITLGSTPYPGLGSATVLENIKKGELLSCPLHSSEVVNNIILSLWQQDPEERPTFYDVCQTLEKLLESQVEYVDLDQMDDHEYTYIDPLED